MERTVDEVTLIARPRRFGKTLTMSMADKYIDLLLYFEVSGI